jgi:hypothetical protein
VTALTTDDGAADFTYDAPAGFYVSEPAIGLDGTLFYGQGDNLEDLTWGLLYSLDPSNYLNWGRILLDYNPRFAPLVGSDGTIVLPFGYGLRAFSPVDGTLAWEYRGADRVTGDAPAINTDGTCYLGCEGALIAVAPDGILNWRFEHPGRTFLSPVITSDGTIIAGTTGGGYWNETAVFAITAEGTLRWTLPGRNCLSSPVLDDRERIYLTMADGYLTALDLSGKELWTFEQKDDLFNDSAPAIGLDGTLYAGTRRGRLIALRTGSGGLSTSSPWPCFRGGYTNTGRPPGTF